MKHAAWIAIVAAAALAAGSARAQAPDSTGAPADTSFGRYLESLRDSTNAYFGPTVAPVDTAGLDSALAVGLANPKLKRRSRALVLVPAPWLSFNRCDGPVYGGSLEIGRPRRLGAIDGRLGYAVGADTWLGAGGYTKTLSTGPLAWRFDAEAGRLTASMDHERSDARLGALRALLSGGDSRRYLRRDGLDASLAADHAAWRGRVRYRDMLESALPVTARWNLAGSRLKVSDNLAARHGHVHELGYLLGARTPWLPFTTEAEYLTSGDAIGSDFEYRRTRLSLGGDVALGHSFALVPQFSWGRLSGQPVPQAAFYLGGSHTLRSLEGSEIGGTGMTLARVDLIEMPDLLELMRIPHPAMLPLQLGVFAATGAVWGTDPYGGPSRPGVDWAEEPEFRQEVGTSILYRPGLPDPSTYMQLGWAWPIGPHATGPRFSVSYSRGVDLVKPFGRDAGP